MSRSDRRYQGGPHYPLDHVRACVGLSQFSVTRRALYADGPRVLPSGTLDVFGVIKELVVGLTEDRWQFSQQENGQWADVYFVQYEGADLWLKLKIEVTQHAKNYLVVISFHEWDHSRPL